MNFFYSIHCGKRDRTDAAPVLWICLSLIVLGASSVETKCTLHNSTSADHEREKQYLEVLKPLIGQRRNARDKNYIYTLGICADATDEKSYAGVGLMQYANGQNFSLGRYDAVGIMSGQNWLLLTYYEGTKYKSHCGNSSRTSHIMVICDPTTFLSELRILEERTTADPYGCFYLFEISSSIVCSVEDNHSLSSGSVFCIIFFTVAGIYLLLGFLYQRIVAGSKGLEQIPNYGFWRSFGNLQADGCDYVCRCGPRQESHAYRGIDDRIRTDEERDDQLLNM